MTEYRSKVFKDAFFWLVGVIGMITMSAATWSLAETSAIGSRLSVVEDSRFTKADAFEMEIKLRQEMVAAVTEIKDCLVAVQQDRGCN